MLYEVCEVSDLQIGQGKQFNLGEGEIAISLWRQTDGTLHAIEAMCPHAGDVPLCEGELDGHWVECWAHGAKIDLLTGKASLPITRPVQVYPVVIEGTKVMVEVNK